MLHSATMPPLLLQMGATLLMGVTLHTVHSCTHKIPEASCVPAVPALDEAPQSSTTLAANVFPAAPRKAPSTSPAGMHADSRLSALGGTASAILVDESTASLLNTSITDSTASGPHALVTARGRGATVWVSDVQVTPDAEAPRLFRAEGGAVFQTSSAGVFDAAVFDVDAQGQVSPVVLAMQSEDVTFATPAEVAQLQQVRAAPRQSR